MEEADSNPLILPSKKKNKEKVKNEVKHVENKKLSKSQKRKLKKLAEEKEKDKLLSKSLEALEKYTISEDSYSLLWSSQNIGQALTVKEKRRRDMQFTKAGLEAPQNDLNSKKRKVQSSKTTDVLESHSLQGAPLESVPIERDGTKDTSTSSMPFQGLDCEQGTGDHGVFDSNNLTNRAANEVSCKATQSDAEGSSLHPDFDNDEKATAAVGERDDDSGDDICGAEFVSGTPDPRPLITPFVVHVSRPKEVEETRKDLPIIMKEQEIMEAINNKITVIICGETGCGKTTQVPQFLYEAGYGSRNCSTRSGVIGVTQPRRVAVLSTAKRVAYELGLRLGKEVGFQVRHDRKIGESASIKFMTDGILLRELQSDFLMKRYSVLILDEAHERSLNTDILIGMLSRVIKQRLAIYEDQCQRILGGELIRLEDRIYPLKLILMSATLRTKDFTSGTRIFDNIPPQIDVAARQFPVTVHFSKRTELVDYIGEAYKKVLKIHKRLPPGGILVFVTGQREVEYLCRKLRNASKQFRMKSSSKVNSETEPNEGAGLDQIDGCDMKEINEALDTHTSSTEKLADRFSYDQYHDESDGEDSYSSHSSGDEEEDSESDEEVVIEDENAMLDDDTNKFSKDDVKLESLSSAFEALAGNTTSRSEEMEKMGPSLNSDPSISRLYPAKETREDDKDHVCGPLHVLPLYAMLPAAAQLRVFGKTKEGERLVVVATNVAETSLTIPGIKYVVDTGREKVKKYNSSNGMESYEVQWISRASAKQRAGRAGRTGPGHCYRLYSSAAFTNEFPEHSCPEILKIPVDGVVLLMKSMGISKVQNFPFPTPPDHSALAEAERCLKALEALDSEGRLTPLGKTMAQYPMSPRHSRLLLLAIRITKEGIIHVRPNRVLGYAIAVAAALSLSNPFLFQFENKTKGTDQDEEDQDQKNKLLKKQLKECAKRSRAKFSNLKSDALTVAYALQCFEQSQNASLFCQENALHQKTMEEMSKLRHQLLQLVFNQRYCGLDQEFTWTHGTAQDVENDWRTLSDKNPLSQTEEGILCQAICAGWADRVAKRIRGTAGLAEEDRKVNAVRYQASMVKETVFLRLWSSVAKSAPEFLVYSEMLHTKRPYIHGATSVESEWLVKYAGSLCTFSAPLEDPKPVYDPYNDQVLCYVTAYFGPHLWELPLCKMPIKDAEQRVLVFAYALLDGQVLPCLKSVKKYMSALPSSILRPESLGQKRVGNLLSKLKRRSRTIDSCAKLREAWKVNPRQLYSEIRDWFQDGFQSLFEELWETMQQEALLAPEDRFRDTSRKKKRGHRKSE